MSEWRRWGASAAMAVCAGGAWAGTPERAQAFYRDGNYQEAHEAVGSYLFDASQPDATLVRDFAMAIECLERLNRVHETDGLREKMAAAHPGRWRVLQAVAESYQQADPNGFLVAGEFQRGPHRGGGTIANAAERDRIWALQLMDRAAGRLDARVPAGERAQFYLRFAAMFLEGRGHHAAWRLGALSDLRALPDVDAGPAFGWGGGPLPGAPVEPDGTPVYHRVPASWDAATTDGQRWRWLLDQAARTDPSVAPLAQWTLAEFLHSQFGVQTMAQYGFPPVEPFSADNADEAPDGRSGPYAVHTLSPNETIARLATGTLRFTLPDEFNYIRLYRGLAAGDAFAERARNRLAEIFSNRRQYPEAAAYWRESIERHGAGDHQWKQKRLDQIVGNWGQFETVAPQPAGQGATIDFRYRNASRVYFSAHAIDTRRLLTDVKRYLQDNPAQLDWQRLQVADLGYRLIEEYPSTYVGRRVAEWFLDLDPAPDHFDRRVTVATPLREPGAYLVTAQVKDGNQCRIVLWVQDTVLVRKPLAADPDEAGNPPVMYYVGDARTGAPVAHATVEFFGYWREAAGRQWGSRRYNLRTAQFAERSDPEGLVFPRGRDLGPAQEGRQWLAIATTPDGRFAFLGFESVWRGQRHQAQDDRIRTYGMTDRPVYRPGQIVNWKAWVRRAQYDQEEVSQFAGRTFQVRLLDPQNNEIFERRLTADAYGGIDGALPLRDDAALGVYRLQVDQQDAVTFRVEEYKKPEFEVTIEAPAKPVALGEKIPVTVRAKYYFGGPVTEAIVAYKVIRTAHAAPWYPPAPWDWLYGPGYWWFGYDYPWYPGWRQWGCPRPWPFWLPRDSAPPEVVAAGEAPIGPDGTLRIDVDTGLAKAHHGDQDHRYAITAEVRDLSRRTIVGTGEVLVAREPFQVHAWVDRGYYRVGDTVHAHFSAHTLDQQPVTGSGVLTLFRIRYDQERTPIESAVRTWDLDTDAQGRADLQLTASAPGQYRLSYAVTDPAGHVIEGGYLFTVRGEGGDHRQFRFSQLELVPDRRNYAPGDTVNLAINTEQADSTVVLFIRPANGVYLKPRVLRLRGASTVVPIAVDTQDMPNFFIEAFTVSGGRLYREVREIHVPPVQRVLEVEVTPSAASYRPGETATLDVSVRDANGDPFQGTAVLTVYDRAVEYISGGSNVEEIRKFFWSWRRTHYPQGTHNLEWTSHNLTRKEHDPMLPLAVFGASVADEESAQFVRRAGGGRPGLAFGKGADTLSFAAAEGAAVAGDLVPSGLFDTAGGGEEAPVFAETAVRTDFADTAFWVARLDTDESGHASVTFDMPENLTGWKVRTWAMGHGTRVGEAAAEVVTAKNLMVRLQAPRFFVEKDEVVLSANIMNRLGSDKTVRAILELEGDTVVCLGNPTQDVAVAAGGEVRVDWRVRAVREGEVTVRMKALTDEESDAMQMTFPVYVHGMLKTDSFSGVVRRDQPSSSITLRVPAERRPDETRLDIRWSPTLAGALVDALPYLVEYPYGCTEQTLSRFLPTVITRNILLGQGLDLEAIRDKRTNLNAQELGEAADRAAQWKRFDRNPVFDAGEVENMVRDGLRALYDMQLADGGWGWFSGRGERSSAHLTAYVVHGLQIAEQQGLTVVPSSIERGVDWLVGYQQAQIREIRDERRGKSHPDNLDAFVFMVLTDAGRPNADMQQMLYDGREHLAVYAKAMFALALDRLWAAEARDMLLRNIEQYLVTDEENQTAWLNLPGTRWWCWYDSEWEAHAYYLKLLSRVAPTSDRAAGLVKYLLNNRKNATYWSSTRDTAVCIEAMAEYLKASGEATPDMTVEILVDGQPIKRTHVTANNLFTFDNRLVLEGQALATGEHLVEIRRTGEGPVFFNAYLALFSLEDPIPPAGLEIKVERNYYRLEPADHAADSAGTRGQVVRQKVEKYQRIPLPNLAAVTSGDLVEIELVIDSKNDYEYLVFEDLKPAGFEPVDVRSGYTGNPLGAYVEFRDERVAFFVTRLARGSHSVSYRARAEIPGQFSALPARAHAMYAPELRANSGEIKLRIEDESSQP